MICTKCNETKDRQDFYSKGKNTNRVHSMCKKCFNAYCIQRWKDKKIKAIVYLGGKCIDCRKEYPSVCYDFHHRKPNEKDFDWGKLRLRSWDKITAELDKCDLLCSNCHRLHHSN